MLKYLQFNNSKDNKITQRVEKYLRLNKHNNKEKNDLDKYESKI